MLRNIGRNPRSYDEIARWTVADPDSSVRPTQEQEQAALEGFRASDTVEQALHDRVVHALAEAGITSVTVEVNRDLVILRGWVPDITRLRTLENTVASVPGVTTIHDQVVVGHTEPGSG